MGFSGAVKLEHWENASIDGLKVIAVPALCNVKQNGYVFQGEGCIYFGGDTGFFTGLKEIGEKFKIDVALLPIDGVKFRGTRRMGMNPSEAARMLKAKIAIPIHYHGNYNSLILKLLRDFVPGTPEQFCEALSKLAPEVKAVVLQHGRSWQA